MTPLLVYNILLPLGTVIAMLGIYYWFNKW